MLSRLPWLLAFGLAATAVAQDPGSIQEVGDSRVSAMMVCFCYGRPYCAVPNLSGQDVRW